MPVCYIIEGPTCAGKTTLAKGCVKQGRLLVPSYCFHVSNVGSQTQEVKDLHYFGEHTPASVEGESVEERQMRILDEFKRLQDDALDRVREGESIVMDFSTFGVRPFTNALIKRGLVTGSFKIGVRIKAQEYFFGFVDGLKNSGADVYITMLCPPADLISQRLDFRNREGDDAWDLPLIAKIACEYQEAACDVMMHYARLHSILGDER